MIFVDLALAFVVALTLTLVFRPVTFRRRTGNSSAASSILVFFVILMLATWAGGLWLPSIGPQVHGITWVPFVLVGLFVAVLLVILGRFGPRPFTGSGVTPLEGAEVATFATFGILSAIFVIGLLIAILSRYVLVQRALT